MNKKRLLKLLKLKEERKASLVAKSELTEDVKELRSINTELVELNSEIVEFRSMLEEIEAEEAAAQADGNPEADDKEEKRAKGDEDEKRTVVGTFTNNKKKDEKEEKRTKIQELFETRGADLRAGKEIEITMGESVEERAITVASSNLIQETKYSRTLNDSPNEVSSLIDRVNAVPLVGGNAYEKGFITGYGDADYTTETGAYNDDEPTMDYVSIGKAKITAYTEITDEAKVLPNIDYTAVVAKGIRTAIRKKITKQLMTGAGGSNAITGILEAPTKCCPTAADVEISAIDEDTLDSIVFGLGGDEDVEGDGTLILNKTDLAAFAAVRLADGKKAYKITKKGNTGTISGEGSFQIPYIINSACPALSAAATANDTLCMAYGYLSTYEMPVFSKIKVEESRDFKFSTGQICYRGVIWMGGNVAAYKSFTRIKKVAAA